MYIQCFKFQKGHNSYKNSRKMRILKLDLKYSKIKSYAKFQLNVSMYVREKCGILSISSILSYKRDITPTKIDLN